MLNSLFISCGLAGAVGASALASVPAVASNNTTGTEPCDALVAAGLRNRILLPTDGGYEPRIETWYATNTRQHPWCLVLPESTEEVALTLSTLLQADNGAGDWSIAVKSGGHGYPGSNNVVRGVTIDLGKLNTTTYDAATNIAGVGTGGRWEYVYADLEKHGVTAVGGRDGDVGVGGFLLGGGTSFFAGQRGFGCDSVVNYEVVLTNGSVVNANASSHSDLWKALKGGGSNFGIVTRFDLEALPTRDLYYDNRVVPLKNSETVISTVVDFANHDESEADNALVALYTYDAKYGNETVIVLIYANVEGDAKAGTSYEKLQTVPALTNKTKMITMAEAAAGSKLEGASRGIGATILVKNDPAIVRYMTQLHEELIKTLNKALKPGSFQVMCILQPVPSLYGRISQQRGGNMLNLENVEGGSVMWTGGVGIKGDEADEAVAHAHFMKTAEKIKAFSESVNGARDLVYMNYAEPSQDPLGSYGAENLQFMRDVAAEYDPQGMFQNWVRGGFKVSKAQAVA